MKHLNKMIKLILAAALVTSFALSGTAVAGACKGLKSKECSSNKSCAWVKGYTKKDGTKVKAHCKAGKGMAKDKAKK